MSLTSANTAQSNTLPLGLHTVIAQELSSRLIEIKLPNHGTALEHGDLVSIFKYLESQDMPAQVIRAGNNTSMNTSSRLVSLSNRVRNLFKSAASHTLKDQDFIAEQQDNHFDYIVSQLRYHQCNPILLTQQYFAKLKMDGFVIGACFGPDTLIECRQAWQNCGVSLVPDNIPDMHDVGDLLLSNGFSDPVVDSETFTIPYNTADEIINDLIAFEETGWWHSHGEQQGLLTPRLLQSFKAALNEILAKKSTISFEVVFFHGWKTEQAFKQKPNSDGEISIPLHLSGLQK